ncbi:MAG: radical SAM protein [Sedimentisphaerales bacterium]|nr:radical SAM protein [Sedimentisphaerales bacterium]
MTLPENHQVSTDTAVPAQARDRFRIDGHKLIYHVERVYKWLQDALIYPIYMEISPTSRCNHRCLFCALDYLGYPNRTLETAMLKERLTEIAHLGVKSIMFAGEGEPFLHPDMADIICHSHRVGLDVALTTNGVLLKPDIAEKILPATTWIKVSIAAGTPENYAYIHQTQPRDFDRVIENMTTVANLRRKTNAKCALGMQLLLLPDNYDTVCDLARIARETGMDYLVVKPYSHNPLSKTQRYKDIKYNDYIYLDEELKTFNNKDFNVIFRLDTMQRWDHGDHAYNRCQALPFWSYLDAAGNIWGCSTHMNDNRFCYGNLYADTFQAIWVGPKRKASLQWVRDNLDISQCRVNCRMDKINQYLWELKHPPQHVNFI